MLLIVAVLSFFLIDVGAQIQECRLASSLQEVYENFMRDANPEMIWNVAMSNRALEELNSKGSVLKPNAPYIAINATRAFDKNDKNLMEKKSASNPWPFCATLQNGVNFGCNGVFTARERGDVLTVLCFFQNYGTDFSLTSQ